MNNQSDIIIKKVLYAVIVLLVTIPLVQQVTELSYVVPLNGAVEKVEEPVFTLDNWFDNEYQSKAEKLINNKFGFRPSFVRLNNQLDYWLFDVINAKSVLMGKDGHLYEYSYIKEYLGKNFIGKEEIKRRAAKTKAVSDSLAARNIDLVVLFAAGKASYFPDYFPDSLAVQSKTISNYDYFTRAFDSAGIKNIDFNKWFISMRDTSRYPLFTVGGIHWSKYAETLVADSLISYIEAIRGVNMPHYQVNDIELSIIPQYRDNDIGEGLNLIFPISSEQLAYPKVTLDNDGMDSPIRAMVVADSYYWELYNMGFSREVFSNGQFWYYNKKIYSSEPGWSATPVEEVDIRREVEKNDIVFILQTEATLYRYAFGFIEKQLDVYANPVYQVDSSQIRIRELNSIIRSIKSSEEWYASVLEKAKKRGMSIDDMLENEARYVLDNRKEK